MKLSRNNSNGEAQFIARLQESVQVGYRIFLFCATSIAGFSAVAWVVLAALDPRHSLLTAALLVARFSRIPWAVDACLATFFAFVNWRTSPRAMEPSKSSGYCRVVVLEKHSGFQRTREVS